MTNQNDEETEGRKNDEEEAEGRRNEGEDGRTERQQRNDRCPKPSANNEDRESASKQQINRTCRLRQAVAVNRGH